MFDGQTDVGNIQQKGSMEFDDHKAAYTLTGSGSNMWAKEDAFYFVWKKLSGDLSIETKLQWIGTGTNEHRKAGLIVRQSLEPDSPYVDAVVHGDGLTSLQYRQSKGGQTNEVKSPLSAPARIRLERNGDVFSLSVAEDDDYEPAGSISIQLSDPVYVGLAVCSHEAKIKETALFSDVKITNDGTIADKDRVTESTLEIMNIETQRRRIVYRAKEHFEAPNWSRDGKSLIFNSKGKIYKIPTTGGRKELIDTGFADHCNNDHGLSPDGKSLVISHHNDGDSLIYILPAEGGTPKLVTEKGPSYWHGWSPDGKTLVYCAERNGKYDVYSIGVNGGPEKQLTTAEGLDDGPEYSPDGKYIYFNSDRTGLMKIWQMFTDGSNQQQITSGDEYGDWFAHPSPDGKWLVFLSYDKSVKGHPANKDIALRIMPASGGEPKIIAQLFGGQGTINVPSWSPDSKEIAFVSYRLTAP